MVSLFTAQHEQLASPSVGTVIDVLDNRLPVAQLFAGLFPGPLTCFQRYQMPSRSAIIHPSAFQFYHLTSIYN